MFKIEDGREHFYQWDLNRKLIIENPEIIELHYHVSNKEASLVCAVREENGLFLADVPNILLQKSGNIRVYGYCADYTIVAKQFEVKPRIKPSDYIYTETEVKTWEALDEKIVELSQTIEELDQELSEKIGVLDYIHIREDEGKYSVAQTDTHALGKLSSSFGDYTRAGVKGFKISKMLTDSSEYRDLDDEKPLTLENGWYDIIMARYEDSLIGESYSISLKGDAPRFGVVTGVTRRNSTTVRISVSPYFHPNKWNTLDWDKRNEYYQNSCIFFDKLPHFGNTNWGYCAHAEGNRTNAYQEGSHSEGINTDAMGVGSHTEGIDTIAYYASHAEGLETEAISYHTHAEGNRTKATAANAHSEGNATRASGENSHAEGANTESGGYAAHSEGQNTNARGKASHTEGFETEATGAYSHAGGYGTKAKQPAQTVVGKFNEDLSKALFIVGNGQSDEKRSNAFVVCDDGTARVYAEPAGGTGVVNKDYLDKRLSSVHAASANNATNATNATYANNIKAFTLENFFNDLKYIRFTFPCIANEGVNCKTENGRVYIKKSSDDNFSESVTYKVQLSAFDILGYENARIACSASSGKIPIDGEANFNVDIKNDFIEYTFTPTVINGLISETAPCALTMNVDLQVRIKR